MTYRMFLAIDARSSPSTLCTSFRLPRVCRHQLSEGVFQADLRLRRVDEGPDDREPPLLPARRRAVLPRTLDARPGDDGRSDHDGSYGIAEWLAVDERLRCSCAGHGAVRPDGDHGGVDNG